MRRRSVLSVASALALASAVGLAGLRVVASDHRDGPSVVADPATDITDVFAFMRPVAADGGFARSDHLVLMLSVHPSAPAGATFDPRGEFFFTIAGAKPAGDGFDLGVDVSVACRFQPPADGSASQAFICSANGFFFAGETDVVSGNADDPFRVFAGRRADPAFGAVTQSLAALQAGQLPDAGTNEFANQSVLAIVAEIDVDRVLFADAGRRPLLVAGGVGRFQ